MKPVLNREKLVRDVIVVGASAGGIEAVSELLSLLPADLPALLGVVIHRGSRSQKSWSQMFAKKTRLQIVEPADGECLRRGVVYIAPADKHMTFRYGGVFLDSGAQRHHTRPAVDPLFESAAHEYTSRVVGVVLTGGGHDGTQGFEHIATAGGLCLVQLPAEATLASMPEHALAGGHVDAVLTIEALAHALATLALGSEFRVTELPRASAADAT